MAGDGLVTEVRFTLPRGYRAPDGSVHRDGIMRAARARDELAVLRDPSAGGDEGRLAVLLLGRVVRRLGEVEVTPDVIEDLLAADFEHLVRLFEQLNADDPVGVVRCPHCAHGFEVDLAAIVDGSLGK